MLPFAVTLARGGYRVLTFDFDGHGRSPVPLAGSIVEETGATRTLMDQTLQLIDTARTLPGADGRVALLGHSMASDIIIRAAQSQPDAIGAVVAVSVFSPAVEPGSPANLLTIVGAWEPEVLRAEALRITAQSAPEQTIEPGVTYGSVADGSARRTVFAPAVEHIAVLYSATAVTAARDWLDMVFDRATGASPGIDGRGPWILLVLAGLIVLGKPLSRLLPRVVDRPSGAGVARGRMVLLLLGAAVATPLVLSIAPTRFLPVLVADYLVVHFALFGVILAIGTAILRQGGPRRPAVRTRPLALILATAGGIAYALGAMGGFLDREVAAFQPTGQRLPLAALFLAATLCFFWANDHLTKGPEAPRWAGALGKLALFLSLAGAVALDVERLFFLIIILPVIVLFLLIYGLFGGWMYRATGHPLPGAATNAAALAWALAATFPLLSTPV